MAKVTAGTYREVWRSDVPLNGGSSIAIATGIRARPASLSRVFGILQMVTVGGSPTLSAVPTSVNEHLVVTITNSAAPGNSASWELNVLLTHSLQQGEDISAPGAIYVIGTGNNGAASEIVVVESIADLRTWEGGVAPGTLKAAIVKGYYTESDGGGGVFIWTSFIFADDGGIVIVPTDLPQHGCWIRLWHGDVGGDVEAAWFGALGDNTVQTAPLQAAVSFAQSLTLGVPEFQGFDLTFTQPSVMLRAGRKYQLDDTLSMGLVGLKGDQSVVWSSSQTKSLIAISGTQNQISGLILAGGLHHIEIDGSVGGYTSIDHIICNTTAVPGSSSIFIKHPMSGSLFISNFKFDASAPLEGFADLIVFQMGNISYDVQHGPAFKAGGRLVLNNVLGTPFQPVPPQNKYWIELTDGWLYADHARFGGESGGAPILHYSSTAPQGQDYAVVFTACDLYCADRAWAVFEGSFPTSFSVIGCRGLRGDPKSGSVLLDDIAQQYLYSGEGQSTNITLASGMSFPIVFRDLSYNLIAQPEIIANMASFSRRVLDQPQTNLFTADTFDYSQLTDEVNINVTVVGTDSSLGYTLTEYKCGVPTSSMFRDIAWGPHSSGTYCVSFEMRVSYPIVVDVTYDGFHIDSMVVNTAQGRYQRIYVPFYHDASNHLNPLIGILCRSETQNVVFSIGLFAIHTGKKPAPYLYPQNPTTGLILGEYHGNLPPAIGTYQVGDRFITDAPTVGQPYMWICTSSAPLTWTVAITL